MAHLLHNKYVIGNVLGAKVGPKRLQQAAQVSLPISIRNEYG